MKVFRSLSFVALLVFALSACVLTLQDPIGSQGEGPITVTYRIETSGNASVTGVRWVVSGSTLSESGNLNSWTRTVSAFPGARVFLEADATTQGGTVRISFEARRDGTVVSRGLLNCSTSVCSNFSLSDTLPSS